MGATPALADEVTAGLQQLQANVSGVLLGKTQLVKLALTAVLAEGHLLIEDVPGVGKTLLAKALARSLGCSFHRIQFTPDLLPSDLIGTSVYQQSTGTFSFQSGPIFAQVVLADEINRATPRTQSALLEAMGDRQVSMDGKTHQLGPPFLVFATQNPFEFEGTYPLPESQLDRFTMRLEIGYPDRRAERDILSSHRDGEPVDKLGAVMQAEAVVELQQTTRRIQVDDAISDYVLSIVDATRNHAEISLGASPRAALSLYRSSQAAAMLNGRSYVVPDDVKNLVAPVLAHRILTHGIRHAGKELPAIEVLQSIVAKVPIPS